MSFDLGFNFRSTSGFVTDPSYAVPVLAEVYPNTYTASNGASLNGGWVTNAASKYDYQNTNDVRIAGCNYSNATRTFQIDLSSGSAPGAGDYTVDMAVNINGQAHTVDFILKDNTTALLTLSNTVSADRYDDATGTSVAATTTWGGTTSSYTFASTTINLAVNPGLTGEYTGIAHFRLTQAGGPASYTLTAAKGTLSMSGQAASPRASRVLTGAKGTLAMTGRPAGVRANRNFPGAKGTLTLTGAAATKGLARRLTAATGSFSLAGAVSLTSMLRRLAATTGSLVLTGRNATLRYTVPGTSTYRDRRDTAQPFRRHYS